MAEEDPCAVLAELRQRHRDIITGKATRLTEVAAGNGGRQRVEKVTPDVKALEREIVRYTGLCNLANGGRPARHAIEFG